MKRLPKFLASCAFVFVGIILCLVVGGYIAWQIFYPTIDIRYRLTLDVDVNGVRHTGSGVVEIEYNTSATLLRRVVTGAAQGLVGFMHGDAITVDLGDRGLLFVVNNAPCFNSGTPRIFVKARNLSNLPLALHESGASRPSQSETAFLRGVQHQTDIVGVLPEQLPMLIRFRDIQDRGSAQAVDPRDLARAFGSGVKLVEATLQVTSDSITPTPSSWPSWLVQEKKDARLLFRDDAGKNEEAGCYLSTSMFKGLMK